MQKYTGNIKPCAIVAGPTDPLFEVTFAHVDLKQHDHGKKRVGRPRLNWVKETLVLLRNQEVKKKYRELNLGELRVDRPEHVRYIKEVATNILYFDGSRL